MAIDVSELRLFVSEPTEFPHDFDSYYDEEADVSVRDL